MKKYIALFLVGLVISSGFAVFAQTDDEKQNNIEQTTIVFSHPAIIDDEDYSYIIFNEENSYLMEQGKPLIPSYLETYYFPFGTEINSVVVTIDDSSTQTLSKMLAPTPEMLVSGQKAEKEYILDYGTEPYPSTWYAYRVGCGRFNNELKIVVTVEVYPLKYHPETQMIEYISEAEVLIDYETIAPTPTTYTDNYQLVVIAPSEFSSQIAPLITHKIGRGITSKFVSLTDIYNGVYFPATGRDNQEKIKYFIKNAIENWLTGSVLLVGGSNYVPARDTYVRIANDPQYGEEVFVTDLYYADIYDSEGGFSSWDTNNNDRFGEYDWEGQYYDEVDLYPDVYIGRLPATSGTQVTTAVNKIMYYENNPGYLQDWFANFVAIGGDTFVGDTNQILEGEYSNEKAIEIMNVFIPNRLWATNGKLGGVVPTGVANIQTAINDGCGFVDFSGHGNTNIWATHPHENSNIWIPTPFPPGGFRITNIQSLANGNKLPIVTVEACSTAKFNIDTNCFNWAFLYQNGGGAIGIFGATAIGYGYGGTAVIQGLIGKIGLDTYRGYRLDGATTLGGMWARSINRYIKSNMNDGDHKTVREWILFGDPTLAIAEESQPPAKPQTPDGPNSPRILVEHTYTTTTTDPEGDKIYYMFNWGDDTTSGWVGPFNSGATASAKKTWNRLGDYQITVIARDEQGQLSEWSDPLQITVRLSFNYMVQQLFAIVQQQSLKIRSSINEFLNSYNRGYSLLS